MLLFTMRFDIRFSKWLIENTVLAFSSQLFDKAEPTMTTVHIKTINQTTNKLHKSGPSEAGI